MLSAASIEDRHIESQATLSLEKAYRADVQERRKIANRLNRGNLIFRIFKRFIYSKENKGGFGRRDTNKAVSRRESC